MKKIVLSFIIILIYSSVSIASDWKPGIIYLKNSESVKGEIRIDQELSLVQCRYDNRIRTFSPMQVKLFQFYDQERSENRVYTVVNEHKRSYYPQAQFYELVVTGEITILRKEIHRTIEVPLEYDARKGREEFIQRPAKQETIDFEYFLLSDGMLSRLESFEDQVLPPSKRKDRSFRSCRTNVNG